MRKLYIIGLIALAGLIINLAWAEQFTLSTYYPAPYGVYREMRSQRMAIGDTYYDSSEYCWEGTCTTTIDSAADLIVEGNVGIGTVSPVAKLHIGGTPGTDGIMFPDDTLQTTAADIPTGAVMAFNLDSCPSGWSEYINARGKVIVGLDPGDPSFNVIEETGGEKTHTLTINEIPSHRHKHSTMINWGTAPGMTTGAAGWPHWSGNGLYTSYEGGGAAHNNLQPYIALIYCEKQ